MRTHLRVLNHEHGDDDFGTFRFVAGRPRPVLS